MASQRLLLVIAVAVSCGTHAAAGDLLEMISPGHCSTCVTNHTVVPVYVPMPMAQVYPYSYGRPTTVVRQAPGRPPEPVPKWARPYGTVPVIAIQEPAPKWANVDPSALAVNSLRHPESAAQPFPAGTQRIQAQQQPVQSTTVPVYAQFQQGPPAAAQAMTVAQPVAVQVQAGTPATGLRAGSPAPPAAVYAQPGAMVPVTAPGLTPGAAVGVAPGPQPGLNRQQVAAPQVTAAGPTKRPAPLSPQTRQIKLFNDDTSKPPPGTLGRTYLRPTRMVPWDIHPRVGMLDVEVLDTMWRGLARGVKIKVHAEDMYGNFKPLEGYQSADGIWHFESDPLLPTVPHIYNVHFELIREETIEEVRYGRRFQRLVERNLGSLGVRRIRLIPGRIVDLIFY